MVEQLSIVVQELFGCCHSVMDPNEDQYGERSDGGPSSIVPKQEEKKVDYLNLRVTGSVCVGKNNVAVGCNYDKRCILIRMS